MTDESQAFTKRDGLSLALYQIFVTIICQIILFILLQLTIAPIVVFDKLPEEFWDMSESGRIEVQKEVMETVQQEIKENPNSITLSYYSIIIDKTPSLFLLNNILWLFSFVITGYILFNWKNLNPLPDFSVSLGVIEIVKGFLVGLVIFTIITSFSAIFYFFDYKPPVGEFQKILFTSLKGNTYLFGWSIYCIGIITGIIEELFFRGFLLTQFIRNEQEMFGLFFTSGIFGILHYSPEASILVPFLITLVGYILGRAYLVTGNIWISMVGHAVYNSLGITMAYLIGDKL